MRMATFVGVHLLAALTTAAIVTPSPVGVKVCTNKACKKAGSSDTLETLHFLASTSAEANLAAAAPSQTAVSLTAQQSGYGAKCVSACGCLGGCGSGPNCLASANEGIFHDVYKPASCAALLAHTGIHVPDAAVKAWVRRMYAIRSLRQNKPTEAHALLTQALQQASPLRANSALLLAHLLDLRADVSDSLGDIEAAAADRKHASQMHSLMPETASAKLG